MPNTDFSFSETNNTPTQLEAMEIETNALSADDKTPKNDSFNPTYGERASEQTEAFTLNAPTIYVPPNDTRDTSLTTMIQPAINPDARPPLPALFTQFYDLFNAPSTHISQQPYRLFSDQLSNAHQTHPTINNVPSYQSAFSQNNVNNLIQNYAPNMSWEEQISPSEKDSGYSR